MSPSLVITPLPLRAQAYICYDADGDVLADQYARPLSRPRTPPANLALSPLPASSHSSAAPYTPCRYSYDVANDSSAFPDVSRCEHNPAYPVRTLLPRRLMPLASLTPLTPLTPLTLLALPTRTNLPTLTPAQTLPLTRVPATEVRLRTQASCKSSTTSGPSVTPRVQL